MPPARPHGRGHRARSPGAYTRARRRFSRPDRSAGVRAARGDSAIAARRRGSTRRAPMKATRPSLVQCSAACGRIRYCAQVDGRCPGILGQARRLVPEIVGLMKQYSKPRPRGIHSEALRIVHNRHPGLEMWVNLVGIVLVVQELGGRPSGVNDHGIEPGRRKRCRPSGSSMSANVGHRADPVWPRSLRLLICRKAA